jgi:hypothetical protein
MNVSQWIPLHTFLYATLLLIKYQQVRLPFAQSPLLAAGEEESFDKTD